MSDGDKCYMIHKSGQRVKIQDSGNVGIGVREGDGIRAESKGVQQK